MPWDRHEGRHVLDDPRNFIVGLSDEGGAGANVGFAVSTRGPELGLGRDRVDGAVSRRRCLWRIRVRVLTPVGATLCHASSCARSQSMPTASNPRPNVDLAPRSQSMLADEEPLAAEAG